MAMRKQKLLCLTFLLIGATALTAPVVQAQSYPVKPVRIVVPTAPGGGTDLIGRLLAQNLSSQLGQQFIVDNRAGAGTTIGTAAVAKSPADGYTLLLTHSSLAFNATYYSKLPYDTLKDFAPISLVAEQPFPWSRSSPSCLQCIPPCRQKQLPSSLRWPKRIRGRLPTVPEVQAADRLWVLSCSSSRRRSISCMCLIKARARRLLI